MAKNILYDFEANGRIYTFEGPEGTDPSVFSSALQQEIAKDAQKDADQNKSFLEDVVTKGKAGILSLPGSVTGLLDIPVAAVTGKPMVSQGWEGIGQLTGFQPSKWAEEANQKLSPQYLAQQQAISNVSNDPNASGMDLVRAYLANPSAGLAGPMAESIPSMLAGGAGAARMLGGKLAKLTPALRAGIVAGAGEGAVTAGQIRDSSFEQGVGTPEEERMKSLGAAGAGTITGLISGLGGAMTSKLGILDPDSLFMKAQAKAGLTQAELDAFKTAANRNIAQRVGLGMVQEGLIEEMPQSAQERMWQNWIENKPLTEGVKADAIQGALLGAGMGGTFNIPNGARKQYEEALAAQNIPAPVETPAEVAPIDTGAVGPVLTGADIEDQPIDTTIVPQITTETAPTVSPVAPKVVSETPIVPTLVEPVIAPIEPALVEPITSQAPVVKIPVTTNEAEQKAALDAMKALPVGGMIEMNGAIYKKNDKSGYDIVSATTTPEPVATAPVTPAPVETAAPAVTPTEVVTPTLVEAVAEAPVEKPKTQAQKNQERQQEKKISAIDANAIPLDAYYNGILTAMANSNKSEMPDVYGDDAPKAIEILKNNNLIAEDKDGKLSLLPAGQSLLTDIRNYNPKNSQEAVSTQDALFAKHIKQLRKPVETVTAEQKAKEKQIAINKARQKAKSKSNTLLTKLIDLGGVSLKDKRDTSGEKQSFAKGYANAFTLKAKLTLRDHIEMGQLDEYLPNNMRLSANTMDQGAFDSEPAYDYLSNLIKNGKSVTPYIEAEKEAKAFERYAGTETMLSDSEGDALDDLVKWATEGGIDIESIKKSLVGENNAQKERNLLRMLQEARDEEQSNAEPIETTERPAGLGTKISSQETTGELKLTGQTEAEIKADEAKVKAAEEAKAKEEAKAEQKAKAEKEPFNLTGSDREADVAGAKDLFATEAEKPKYYKYTTREQVHKDAEAIKNMDADVRDDTEIGDFPGSSDGYAMYEAKKMLPKPSDKLKRITSDNSFYLYQEYDYIANVDGEMYGVTKQEDPDEPDDESKFVFHYNRMDEPSGYDHQTWTDDPKELIKIIKDEATKTNEFKTIAEVNKPSKIEDFGEKIFVKKDAFANFKNKVDESKEVDIETSPLSKSWVEPDYQKLLDEGMSPFGVAFLHSTRDAVPTKPKATWKLRGWVKKAQTLRDLSYGFIDGNITEEQIKEIINKEDEYSNYNYLKNRIDLYLAAGHEKSLKGYELSKHSWTYYKGMKYDPPGVILWDVRSANGTQISESEDREDAIAKFVTAINKPKAEIEKAEIKFGVWSRRGKEGFFIGKKIGKNVIYLKMLPTVKEARDYILNNHDELVAQFEKYKEIPSERGEINQVRVGADHRMGANVSQEQFFDTFGFRSTIFGNTVNNARRQQDLNNAYDALMDLAGVLEIPPKALSMNGEIGLLFGADGRGGKNPASAHYSNSKLAINLTKTNGAGSLAHELFHALDNYFSRMGGDKYKMLTETQKASANVRPEVVAAFKDLMTAISATSIKERSKNLDKRRTKEYWSTGLEMAARAFESYVINKLKDQNASNDYLANIVSEKEFNIEDGYPYPTAAEIPAIRAAFDNFFNVLETKETDKGVMLYNIDTKVQTKTPDEVRGERIQELRVASMKVGKAVKHIADYGSNLPLQRKLNQLLEREASLKDYLESTKPENNSDADFMARATKELAAGNISEEVEAVIRQIYEKYPGVLSGLKLSVKQNKHLTSSAAGAFNPYARIVSLYKDTSGVEDPSTVRHEIVHSLEQMMTPQAAQAVVDAWARAFEKAMKKNIDPASKAYFDAVLEFLASPSKESFEKATNLMPSYDFYQYLNPSEYWAVNAESMLEAKLGTPWNRFVLGVKRLIEGLKSVLGFDNTYVVHNTLNNLLKTTPQRLSKTSLVDYVVRGKVKIDFLNNIDDERRLMDNLGVPNVPSHIHKTLREKISEVHKSTEQLVNEVRSGPNNVLKSAGSAIGDSLTQGRIEAVFYGIGLERADAKKYAGKLRDVYNNMLPSIALKNAIHWNSIYNAVLHQGKMRYDNKLGAFTAYDSDDSMKHVIEQQHTLRQKLGVDLADKVINTWFAAKRTKGIQTTYLNLMGEIRDLQEELLTEDDPEVVAQLTADLNAAQNWLDALESAFINVPSFLVQINQDKPTKVVDGKTVPNILYDMDGMPVLNDEAMDEIIALSDKHAELNDMMKNWTAVNHNMLDNMAFSGRISEKEAEGLKGIEGYSPWQRIRDEEEESLFGNKGSTTTSGIARFRKTRTELPLENVVENMNNQIKRNVSTSLRNFAYNRIAMEYAARREPAIDEKTGLTKVDKKTGLPVQGKLKLFSKEGRDSEGVRFPIYANGKRVIIQIEDSQIADALLGLAMGPVNIPFQAALSGFSNLLRRSITFSGYFQTKQIFYDAPTAAWVSGVKNPFKVWANSFSTYANALVSIGTGVDAPTIKILKAAGVGGYHTFHRESLAEEETTIEAISGKGFAKFKRLIDKIGDASDYAQRGAIYDQVLAETGDASLALLKASDIVDWNKHGLNSAAQAIRQTVPFLGAYAIQLDAFGQAATASGTIGNARKEALTQFYLKTGLGLAMVVLAYAIAAGSDDDYWELDDDTRARNFYVPGSKKALGYPLLIPMHSTAALFFKVMPESVWSYVVSQGTKNEIDATRARSAFWKATKDSLLGPTPIPAAIKTPLEIGLNHSFFTGSTVVPQALAGLDASEQYSYNTSELGKAISVMTSIPFTGNKDEAGNRQGGKRMLNPIEADHLIRGWLGSVGAITEFVSNELFGENRPASQLRDNPLTGGLLGNETSRRNEALFYDLKARTEPAHNTYIKLLTEQKTEEAASYLQANERLIGLNSQVYKLDYFLQKVNAEIKNIGKSVDTKLTKEGRRDEILKLQEMKQQALGDIIELRKLAGL